MSETLRKILNAESIPGETEIELEKRMATDENLSDEVLHQRLVDIYRDNPNFSGINILNVEKILSSGIQEDSKKTDVPITSENKEYSGSFAQSGSTKKDNKGETKMQPQFGNSAADAMENLAKGNVPTGKDAPVMDTMTEQKGLSKSQLSVLSDLGINSEKDLDGMNAAVLKTLQDNISKVKLDEVVAVKPTAKTKVQTYNDQKSFKYGLGQELTGVIVGYVNRPGKDYSKATKSGAQQIAPNVKIMNALTEKFGYNPSTGMCAEDKVAGNFATTNAWVDYIYKLCSKVASMDESLLSDEVIANLPMSEAEINELRGVNEVERLKKIKGEAVLCGERAVRPFGNALFCVDPKAVSDRPAVKGIKMSSGGNTITNTADNSDYWPVYAAPIYLGESGTLTALGTSGAYIVRKVTDKKNGGTKWVGTYKTNTPGKYNVTIASGIEKNKDRITYVSCKVKLPVDLKYVEEGKTKSFNMRAFVPVYNSYVQQKTNLPNFLTVTARKASGEKVASANILSAIQEIRNGKQNMSNDAKIALLKAYKSMGANASDIVRGNVSSLQGNATTAIEAAKQAIEAKKKAAEEAKAKRAAAK